MDQRLLEISQYVGKHPILNENIKYKEKYIDTLEYFVYKYCSNDIWSNSLLKLFKEKMIGTVTLTEIQDCDLKKISKGVLSWKVRKCKLFSYRFCLLVDVIFICALLDKNKGKQIFNEIREIYNKRYWRKLEFVFDSIYNGSNELCTVSQLAYIGKCINVNSIYLKKRKKKILVTANMSAGKSTLLNALIGKKVNKTQNDACTAKTHYLLNKTFEDNLIYEYDYELELNASRQILMEDNDNNKTDEIFVGTRFRSLKECNKRICFIDTPGVNSSQNIEHREICERAIQNNNYEMLLYVLNGQAIGTNDERKHLQYIAENYKGRAIFVVNKLDTYRANEDSVEETIAYAKKDIADIGFKDAIVCPVSAYAAYLAKMHFFNEKLNEDELDELELLYRKMSKAEFNFERYYPVEVGGINNVVKNKDVELLLHSGLLSLEKILI